MVGTERDVGYMTAGEREYIAKQSLKKAERNRC